MLYSLWKAVQKWRALTGRKRKSQREAEEEKKDARMRHHHYYCERNPEGFNRLKVEVIDQELRADVLKEVDGLRRTT